MNQTRNHISLLKKTISLALLYSFIFTNLMTVGVFAADAGQASSNAVESSKLTTDLTQLGRQGRLRENLNFENETARLIKVLAGGVSQPVIVDEKGGSQDLIVEQL